MPFNPLEFLQYSRDLEESATTEAEYRTIVSRAYYSVFGHLRHSVNQTFPIGVNVHQKLIEYLKFSHRREGKLIALKLETLFRERKKADYDYSDRDKVYDWQCRNMLVEAEKIMDILKNVQSRGGKYNL